MELFPYVDLKNSLLLKQNAIDKGKPNGFAGLDAQGRVPFAQLPVSITSLATNAEVVANKGAPNGYAPLSNVKRIPEIYMPTRYGEAIQAFNWWESEGLPELVRILQEDVAPKEAGVPKGGSTGKVLAKKSGADYDAEWVDQTQLPSSMVHMQHRGSTAPFNWPARTTAPGYVMWVDTTGEESLDPPDWLPGDILYEGS